MTRIYTEDINRKGIIGILDSHFDAYTIIPTIGRYKGQDEKALVIELLDADQAQVNAVAEEIRQANRQHSVLVTHEPTDYAEFIAA